MLKERGLGLKCVRVGRGRSELGPKWVRVREGNDKLRQSGSESERVWVKVGWSGYAGGAHQLEREKVYYQSEHQIILGTTIEGRDTPVGASDGAQEVGGTVGLPVGLRDGAGVGAPEGLTVGAAVGVRVGEAVVGAGVGARVGSA